MAVQESESRSSESSNGTRPPGAAAGPKKTPGPIAVAKKKPGLVIAGGVGLLFILLAHKGGNSGSGAAQQLQAANPTVQGFDPAAGGVLPSATPPEAAEPQETEPASGTTTQTSEPGQDTPSAGAATDPTEAAADAAEAAADAAAAGEISTAADAVAKAAGKSAATTQSGGSRKKPHGKTVKHGTHPTSAKNHHNTNKTGTTVHGRHFPGATGHSTGAPHRDSHGNVRQTVNVYYGGRKDTHTSHNSGQHWTDHTPGHNPPSRGVAHPSHPQPAHARPVRQAAPAKPKRHR